MTLIDWRGAIAALAVVASCGGDDTPGTDEAKPVTFGAVHDLSGTQSARASFWEKATLLAAQEINDGGGIRGGQLDFDSRDGKSVTADAKTAGADLVAARSDIKMFIGGSTSGTAVGLAEALVPASRVLISGAATLDLFGRDSTGQSNDDGLVFRTISNISLTVTGLVKVMKETGVKRVSVLFFSANPYSINFKDAFKKQWSELGSDYSVPEPVAFDGSVGTVPPTTDPQSVLDQAYAQSPDAILLTSFVREGSALLKTWSNSSSPYGGKWFLSGSLCDPGIPAAAGAKATQFVAVTEGHDRGVNATTFENAFKARFTDTPNNLADGWYDATILGALGMQKAGPGASAKDIARALIDVSSPPGEVVTPGQYKKAVELLRAGKDINYEGASGAVDFTADGDVSRPLDKCTYTATAVISAPL